MRTIRAGLAIACLWVMSAVTHAVDVDPMPTPELQARYDALTHELRCMQCQNQSLADSPVGLASDLRREVREMLIAGRSDQQIRDHMVARYGTFILFRPPFTRETGWIWIAPFVLLAIGLIVTVVIVRQRSRMVAADDTIVDGDERP